jgi:hypothetical protein
MVMKLCATRLFKNRILKEMFGYKREVVQEAGENCIMRSFIIYTLHQISLV